jgi:penicillin amidase
MSSRPRSSLGERQRLTLTNVFAGKLPRFLGFDRGPYELAGCRATLDRSGVFRAHGRLTSFAASWRSLTDLGSDEVLTALPGGPSASRFSRWYTSDLSRWLEGSYKELAAVRFVNS